MRELNPGGFWDSPIGKSYLMSQGYWYEISITSTPKLIFQGWGIFTIEGLNVCTTSFFMRENMVEAT